MAAIGLKRRLTALEGAGLKGFVPWVRVFQDVGQAEEEALAAHATEHGPLADRSVILRVVV